MKLNRLFEIVYILLNKNKVTAKELADRFEVSQRTIYRDVDTLSQSGVPIYATKGKGGGISLVEGYKIDRAMLTETEQREILSALQGINAATTDVENTALDKLSAFFSAGNTDWIEIDFSSFSADSNWKQNFENIKQSILDCRKIKIKYANLKGETSARTVEPIKLIFKGVGWYLYAFCSNKNDYRMFKLNRILCLELLDENFAPHKKIDISADHSTIKKHDEELVVKVNKELAFRIFDDFGPKHISKADDDNYIIKTNIYEKDWILSYILSLGDKTEVLSPLDIREEIAEIIMKSADKYL